jgi:PKHD-type hydroxylase
MPIDTFAVQDGIFTPDELDGLARLGDQLVQRQATVQGQSNTAIRVTRVAWILPEPEHNELFARIGAVVQRLNAQFFRFDITRLEPFQYTVYQDSEGGHYDWHVDCGRNNPAPRKISISIQLSDPSTYEGCDLQFQFGPAIDTAPRTRGAIIAFPSFYRHRVTPVTKGIRRSLVAWANGPEFR